MNLTDCFWDYQFEETDLLNLLHGNTKKVGHLDRVAFLKRMLGVMSWYDVVHYIKPNEFLSIFTPEVIDRFDDWQIRKGLTFVRRFLHSKTVSSSR